MLVPLRVVVCGLDLAFCATATGAHVNGNDVTSSIVQTGAIAGVIASGTVGYVIFVWKADQTPNATTIIVAATWFRTAFIVALAVCNRVLTESGCFCPDTHNRYVPS
jgi:hypothetical protein